MNNLPKYIALEKIVQSIGHGRVTLDLQVRNGDIVGVITTGKKKIPYNSSEEDVNTNERALEQMVRRVSQQLESGNSSEIIFHVHNVKDKIKAVEIESQQTIK